MAAHEAIFGDGPEVVFGWDRPEQGQAQPTTQRAGEAAGQPSSPSIARKSSAANLSYAKRAIDIVGALIGIVLLAPLLLMVAALVRLDSQGPALFRQERYGLGQKRFRIMKFRTMTTMESSGAFRQARRDDDRITVVGRMLRRTSIDELPQLFNVLKGDMSLVGPRPHAISMDDEFAQILPNYGDRHLVRPGLTGLAQISGYRGPTVDLTSIQGRLKLDRAYMRTWSVLADIRIIVMTPLRLLVGGAF